ncbi:MAG TPA: T9SS type A sorting domain-containing protein, partial [Taishania sp.]|nr:T9SS type A sorting domain-containing protein [Taishania sp.]
TNNVFPTNNSVIVTNGTTEFTLRSVTPDLAGQSLPIGPFNVTGIGSQFNNPNSAPFNNGYQLNICGIDAITIPCTGTNVPNTNVNVNGATLSAVNAVGYTYQWINCEDNSEIANATTRTFTATENGSYAVVIENALGCSDTSDCIVIDNVSVASVELMNAVAAYPNPVNDQLTIKNYGDSQVDFVITDINGKVVVERSSLNSETVINTVNWSKGVYFVNMTGVNNASVTLKVIK